jgi:predicted extracellular nuclease
MTSAKISMTAMRVTRVVTIVCIVNVLFLSAAAAQTRGNILNPELEPRGEPELTICSQNLENYGPFSMVRTRIALTEGAFAAKEEALVKRFLLAKCDVIAVQEILAPDENAAQVALDQLGASLNQHSNRQYLAIVGASTDRFLRQGYLLAKDRVELLNKTSYERVELPKLSERQKPRQFTRGPLEIQVRTRARAESSARIVSLINIHFKSRHGGEGDPAELEWEGLRMEMAEAIRRIATMRHTRAFASGDEIFIILGDRNSHSDTASAKILDGTLTLSKFKEGGVCRLSKRGAPLCKSGAALPQKLFSVLTMDPQTKLQTGSHRYEGTYSWLDDILMPAESLPFAWANATTEGDYESGVIYEPREASDHALVWVQLNW